MEDENKYECLFQKALTEHKLNKHCSKEERQKNI